MCRFIGEMTKFGVFSKVDTLFCIKQLLFDFSHHHIEMACALFESCGSFLYRSPDSHRRTKIYLEQMLRKKAAMSLDSRYTTMIENAYYSVAPPESSQVVTRKYLIKLEKYFLIFCRWTGRCGRPCTSTSGSCSTPTSTKATRRRFCGRSGSWIGTTLTSPATSSSVSATSGISNTLTSGTRDKD